MAIFQSQKSKHFEAALTNLFTPAGMYYIHFADAQALAKCFDTYAQAFIKNGATKNMAMISQKDAGIVPYLTVRSNILINGQHRPFALIPEALRKDTLFLDGDATQLSPAQSLYIQLFRGLMAGRQFLLMQDFPENMGAQETRLFLNSAQEAVAASGASLIILTTDMGLIQANPHTSWQVAPRLDDAATA
ncbi:hypothetical protein [Lacticaseibacillus manihotivorans]|jgi:hypothetical protein|uniref:Uncharacterized protein n=2 Tax=Lacticaseibacillus manihotivorans TaxID=88233 RepID=A0A0R1QMP0_9LACO|nr:hypothetical protein [Lacticaseibacillus manihotivorans]KRL43940.1 hypothetical protein FD01_GL001476 [Lacticaseibacillus manihotivorans DSM 13343 = JCM 12514]QFQ92290.1 hypothetical protein LM010_13075 [Lacticaseibacillus manihotivorans]